VVRQQNVNSHRMIGIERDDRCDNKLFEALLRCADIVVGYALDLTLEGKEEKLAEARHELNRVFRSANFNRFAHQKFRKKYERHGKIAPTLKSIRFKVPAHDKPIGLAEAAYSRSPAISSNLPSDNDSMARYIKSTDKELRKTRGSVMSRCCPTQQDCIMGVCKRCGPIRHIRTASPNLYTHLRSVSGLGRRLRPIRTPGLQVENMEHFTMGMGNDFYATDPDDLMKIALFLVEDIGLVRRLSLDITAFLSFLIGVRGLHSSQLPATNWSYSVAMCQFIHTCLTKGGAAEHFDDKEMLVLLLCALSYGIGHKEHEGFLVHTPDKLSQLQVNGPCMDQAPRLCKARKVFELGMREHSNLFGHFTTSEVTQMESLTNSIIQGCEILAMSQLVGDEYELLGPAETRPGTSSRAQSVQPGHAPSSLGATAYLAGLSGTVPEGQQHKGRKLSTYSVSHSLKDNSRIARSESVPLAENPMRAKGNKRPQKGTARRPNLELMQLLVYVGAIHFPGREARAARHAGRRLMEEMHQFGDRLEPEEDGRDNQMLSISPCFDRNWGNAEVGLAGFLDYIATPAFHVLLNRLPKLDFLLHNLRRFRRSTLKRKEAVEDSTETDQARPVTVKVTDVNVMTTGL